VYFCCRIYTADFLYIANKQDETQGLYHEIAGFARFSFSKKRSGLERQEWRTLSLTASSFIQVNSVLQLTQADNQAVRLCGGFCIVLVCLIENDARQQDLLHLFAVVFGLWLRFNEQNTLLTSCEIGVAERAREFAI
jgi:hypothetical protein